ncbi:DUF5808 domain-containing protein [Romboutsia sp.]|uniref:DUF5808 domain-containing protein n=1 Tax=Romboutsia sp. TaxID=1965302 RepID=UPI002CA219FB|nr:DUF5808 domain-containing protein [Romboutsia sp.]HSQ88104.1 DUF5808 domain-containing protein [Romboutsia sp.]
MNSTIALIVNVPTLLLLYVLIYFTQSLSGKRQFYGVSLNSDYFNKSEFKALDKKFKFLVSIGFIIFTIITLICIYLFKAYEVSSILPMLGFCLYQFLVYIHIHNKVKASKSELALNISDLDLEKTKVILDTNFIHDKNRIVKRFSMLFTIPTVIVILVGIYVLTQYESIPNTIPTHWGPSGAADAFAEKSFIKILSQVLMMTGIGVIVYISSIASLKARAKLCIDSLDDSKKAHLHYLNMFGFTFFVLNVSCQIIFISILIATLNASSVNTFVLWSCTIVTILAAIYQTYLYYKSPSKSKNAVYSVDDEDSFWIFGCIYNNPNDPSFFVTKRFGVGWTVNIGTTKGKIYFAIPFVIILLSLVFI